MRVLETPAPHQSSAPSSPVISADQPPLSSFVEPPTSPMREVPVPVAAPKKTTPQRTRRQDTPPPTTATRLRSHITPTKKADVSMVRAQEMRLALLPSAQQLHPLPPPPPAGPSTDSKRISIQPEGVPPTPRVVPPTPAPRPANISNCDVNYAEPCGSRYPSPGHSRQSSMYPDGPSYYDIMMPPPNPRDGYGDGYNHSNNGYRRSPVDPREGSIQPPYQHPEGHLDPYGPPLTRLSPRTDYLAPSGPLRHPSYHPNPYPYSIVMGHAQRSQSPPPVSYGVQRSDGAIQIPSTSPHMVHPRIPSLAGNNERPSQVLSDPHRTGHPSIPIPAGVGERLSRSPPAANHSIPEPVGVDNTSSTQLPALPPAAGTQVSELTGASESHPELPALAPAASPIAAELTGGQERPTQLSPIPAVATQPTTPDSTPGPSNAAKKPGRPSNKSLGLIASTFNELDELINSLASQTGMTRMQLIARWLADAKGANSPTTWNTYLKYFAANKETKAARVSADNEPPHSTAFRSQCYAKYQEEVPDWQERLLLFEELEQFSAKGMTVAQRNRAFRKFNGKLKKLVSNIII
jgi:hypothetical protein